MSGLDARKYMVRGKTGWSGSCGNGMQGEGMEGRGHRENTD